MEELFSRVLGRMEETLDLLVRKIPPPQKVASQNGFVYRYVERTLHQAIVQKLARITSGLESAYILSKRGFVQEQAALQRMIDEFQEDVLFLSHATINNDVTDRHRELLDYFYEEEFDLKTGKINDQKRPMPNRKKIRAYIARIQESGGNPSQNTETLKSISKTYSGYVHGASPQIMDMYGGQEPRFHVRGLLGTPRASEYWDDLWNYFYRGLAAYGVACKAFGDLELFNNIGVIVRELEHYEGKSYSGGI